MNIQTVIEINNLSKSFKDVKAVQDISLEINKGEFVALLGPNGAGKTTLVEMIEGIQKPDKGEILITGKHWQGNRNELNNILGISLQETKFTEKLTVLETLKLFASFYKLGNSRVEEIIDLIQLNEKRKAYVVNLSGGQRQRLALGIALLNKPQVLLLDEPTTGLDPTARHEVWDILKKLKDETGISMILTTHYMEEAEYLCNRIIIMDHGKILAQGTLDDLLSINKSSEIIEFKVSESLTKIIPEELPTTLDFSINTNDNEIILKVESIVSYLPELLKYLQSKNIVLKSLVCRKLTLDDLFISMTGRRLSA